MSGREVRRRDEERLEVTNHARLEQVYFGAAMILHHFPDVTKIEQRLLEAFSDLDPAKSPFRTIRQVAAMLKNVRHGRVTIENVADLSVLGSDSTKRSASRSSNLVRVVAEP
jgi:hypothetical protein